MKKMLILRGMPGHYDGKDWPDGALYEEYAVEYARRMGYQGYVLKCPGYASAGSKQVEWAVKLYRHDPEIVALYGFSAGGYNIRHILNALTDAEKRRLELVVVLGAPKMKRSAVTGKWRLVYRNDPDSWVGGHMAGPKMLLAELGEKA